MKLRHAFVERRSALSFNMTPMIDMAFQLIIFFVLVSRFASMEKVPLELPRPDDSQARDVKLRDPVVINCVPADAAFPQRGALYHVGANPPEPLSTISERLAGAKAANPDLQAVIRADKRLPYSAVRAAMRVVADNRIDMMNIVAHVGGSGGGP